MSTGLRILIASPLGRIVAAPLEASFPEVTVTVATTESEFDRAITGRVRYDVVVADPRDTPWGSRDVEVITPEKVRIIFTAAKPFDPNSQVAKNLEAIGISASDAEDERDGERA